MAFEFNLSASWPAIIFSCYAFFLASYLLYIFYREYSFFQNLHTLKSLPFDGLILAVMFFSIRQFSLAHSDVRGCLFWLSLFLLMLVVWEIYTMMLGRVKYFKAPRDSLKPRRMFKHFFRALTYKSGEQIDHWNEYRYWLMLDALLLAIVFIAYLLRTFFIKADWDSFIYWTIVVLGFYIGGLNIYRYRLVETATVKRTSG